MAKYDRKRHLTAKEMYKFITVRLPKQEHDGLRKASKSFRSQNDAIVYFITWGVENTLKRK